MLIPFAELWHSRNQTGRGTPYRVFGEFGADDYTWLNPASAPWVHDDCDDGLVWPGDVFADPDYAVRQHVQGLPGGADELYLRPPLHTHRLSWRALRIVAPVTQPSLELWADQRLLWVSPLYPEKPGQWRLPESQRYFALPAESALRVLIFDQRRPLAEMALRETGEQQVWTGAGLIWLQAALSIQK